MQHMTKREISRLIRGFEKQGVRIRVTGKGWVLYLPDGTTACFHRTPSDRRAMLNFRARIERSGLAWPS